MKLIPKVEISTDLFLHNCTTALLARRKKDGSFNSHVRFEPFLFETYKIPSNLNSETALSLFRVELEKIVKHHSKCVPQIRRKENITEENIAHFVLSFSSLFADVEDLSFLFAGVGISKIPNHDTEIPAQTNESVSGFGVLVNKFQDYRLSEREKPFAGFESEEEKTLVAVEFWECFSELIHNYLGDYSAAILSFAAWKFQEVVVEEVIDWRVRPPVGEAFQKFQRGLQKSSGTYRKPDFKGGGSFGGSPSRQKQDSSQKPFAKKETRRFEEKPKVKNTAELATVFDEKEVLAVEVPDRKFEARKPSKKFESDDVTLERALSEVKEAMAKLKANPSLEMVTLAPNNSFLRKNQHSFAIEQGFNSESVGEGKERGVCIKRK